MHEVISSSLTVPTKNKSTAYAVLLFLVGNAKESSRRGRKPSAVRVRSAAENFAAHAASSYRPLPRITSDTLKPPKMGGLLRGRFSASAGGFRGKIRVKSSAEVKTRANTTRNAVSLTLRHASDLVPKGTPAPDTSIAGYRRRRSSARQTRGRRRIPLLPCRTILP